MPNEILIHNWLRTLDNEYLSTFVKDGGSSIKFAVTPVPLRTELHEGLRTLCQELGHLFIKLDASSIRVHMPQDIFFELARQIDWRDLARRKILQLSHKKGYQVAGITSGSATSNIFEDVGSRNSLEANFVRVAIEQEIQNAIFKNPRMTKDFRVAMTHLCLKEDTGVEGEYAGQPLLDWLTGANLRMGNVRPFQIYTAINRTTARYFIESAFYWVREAGHLGTLLLLDNARVTLARNPHDGQRYYTKPMTLDHYELLREFVDDIDQLNGALIVVETSQEFLDDTPQYRGYGIYPALRTRVMDDVRDKNRVNPMAPLVRLTSGDNRL